MSAVSRPFSSQPWVSRSRRFEDASLPRARASKRLQRMEKSVIACRSSGVSCGTPGARCCSQSKALILMSLLSIQGLIQRATSVSFVRCL